MPKILIIEDDPDIAAIERDYLELSGYEAVICADGTAGLNAALTEAREELEDMIATQHGAQVDCHFCNKRYEFTEAELQALLHQATGEER